MPYTQAIICNMALGHLGVTSAVIANLDTDTGKASDSCRLYYQPSLDAALEDFAWPEFTRYRTLDLVEDFTAVTTPHDWDYSYRYPENCANVRRIVLSTGRNTPSPAPFALGLDDTGRLIYTNEEDAIIEYGERVEDPALFGALFAEAVSWKLAAFMAPAHSRIKGIVGDALKMYFLVGARAEVKSGNERQLPKPNDSEFTRERE